MIERYVHPLVRKASTVNYLLLKTRNACCGFSFAIFEDTSAPNQLKREGNLEPVIVLCQAVFRKVNFADGEPTLRSWLPDLIRRAKSHGLTTSIVTNGSRITAEWLDDLWGCLDIIALSIDSVDSDIQRKIGRVTKGRVPLTLHTASSWRIDQGSWHPPEGEYGGQPSQPHQGFSFISDMKPERWKLS